MTLAEFERSLSGKSPPAGAVPPLAALWWAATGDWEKAHTIVMKEETREAAWVHAYLHRVEGDLSNARYWYGQAGKPPARGTHEREWNDIASALIGGGR